MPELKLETILRGRELMPRKQRALCEYIFEHANEADVFTAKELAKKAGIGEATVFRFLKEHGYASYGAFRGELHRYAVEFTQSSYWQMKAAIQTEDRAHEKPLLYEAVSDAMELLGKSMTPKLAAQFDSAVELLLSAPRVGVLGMRSSRSVALYFYYLMLPFFPRICQLSYDEDYVFETIKNLPEGSVLLVVTSWPNTRMTVRAAEFCHRLGHKIILLTNSLSCPIAAYADALLVTPEAKEQYTVVPYVTVVEALAREVGHRMAPRSIQRLKEMDQVLAEQEVTNWETRR